MPCGKVSNPSFWPMALPSVISDRVSAFVSHPICLSPLSFTDNTTGPDIDHIRRVFFCVFLSVSPATWLHSWLASQLTSRLSPSFCPLLADDVRSCQASRPQVVSWWYLPHRLGPTAARITYRQACSRRCHLPRTSQTDQTFRLAKFRNQR